ncbi:MAG: hypothetical protein J6S85_23470 [Methanobrevibacter sp.]|nr:hypothetical protein [Methanobrevibacter sp.]
MRCNYRCNMWCNCKKPAKPYPTTPSISAPSESEITLNTESHWIYFGYTPTDATLNVTIESNNPNIAYPSDFSYQN